MLLLLLKSHSRRSRKKSNLGGWDLVKTRLQTPDDDYLVRFIKAYRHCRALPARTCDRRHKGGGEQNLGELREQRRVCRLRRRRACTVLQRGIADESIARARRDKYQFPGRSFGFQCKCKTARNSRWQVTRLADGTPAASLQRLHNARPSYSPNHSCTCSNIAAVYSR